MYSIDGYKGLHLISERHGVKVFQAFKNDTNEGLILKLLTKEGLSDTLKQAFLQEYEIASSHKFEFGIQALNFTEHPEFFLMEIKPIEGTSLKETIIIKNLSQEKIIKIALLMSEAILELHDAYIIHKDINPSNFIISDKFDKVYLIDYGLSQYYNKRNEQCDILQVSQGDIHYIAPEQTGRINKKLDYRTDLYALGVCFYELFTGKRPFKGSDLNEILYQHIAVVAKEPKELNESIDENINNIIMKLLKKEPQERYQSMYGLKKDLQKVLEMHQKRTPFKLFDLGCNDIALEVHDRDLLIDREKEQSLIESCFLKTIKKEKSTLLISGESGIGKSTLVESCITTFYTHQALYLHYKFTQYSDEIPLQSWHKILQVALLNIESLSQPKQESFKKDLKEVLSDDANMLVGFLPQLADQFDDIDLSDNHEPNQGNRLYQVIILLLEAISKYWQS
ncbi:MAG: serine/threonine-protein kinase, partial [Thiovulaceae bacterium]|nr:serine/threonine-protein kinase [Sulfurimonadaceae bacterium]